MPMTMTQILPRFPTLDPGAVPGRAGPGAGRRAATGEPGTGRRQTVMELLSQDSAACHSEYGAQALMALFPRDF